MIRAIPAGILREVLLVIVGAEALSRTEITELSRHGHAAGRLSVDVAVDPPVEDVFSSITCLCEQGRKTARDKRSLE